MSEELQLIIEAVKGLSGDTKELIMWYFSYQIASQLFKAIAVLLGLCIVGRVVLTCCKYMSGIDQLARVHGVYNANEAIERAIRLQEQVKNKTR